MAGGVAIVDYGAGNLRSAEKAFIRMAEETGAGLPVVATGDADRVARASHVVLPGQGAFADCRAGLHALDGMVEALREAVTARGAPFLGICVGMQLLADRGLEHGETPGFGWVPGEVAALEPGDPGLKIPHMGWNDLRFHDKGHGDGHGSGANGGHPVLAGLEDGDHAYFVHSYGYRCADEADLLATCDYGGPVAAIVGRDNLVGTQFHPEKSQQAGLRLIANFLAWRP
ncbi:MAG: imidazole glycerol phosphate synthase subunit HisH [Rhodospirillaceae bacterium]|nr:imidazole glycerol phosphate synthase subunit HisH [Rhodospirillaceae bacterium]MYH38695.1 imidazole glycerol phosphate synthase subunit HisH [Rhodospirillaceae bacterium]MYK14199.1 imidazole glycerol phosphate synthase subunit HisH [Rhodospirillaceae bacterium]MYK57308.1 imidazole glycerol phosphate synthase subunit HisH [Rhodospirillaceae bacterium]